MSGRCVVSRIDRTVQCDVYSKKYYSSTCFVRACHKIRPLQFKWSLTFIRLID